MKILAFIDDLARFVTWHVQTIRREMDSHIREKPEDHLSYIGEAMLAFRRVINEQHETIEKHKTKLADIDARVGHVFTIKLADIDA